MTKKLAVAMPLVDGSEDSGKVVEMMDHHAASAVVIANGNDYRVHSIEEVRATRESGAKVGTAQGGAAIGLLSTKRAADLGLDFSDLKVEWVTKAFQDIGQPAMIAGIARASNGVRFANTIVNPAGKDGAHNFLFIGDTFKCPKDGEVYSKPGHCPVHPDVSLQRVKS